MSKPRTTILYVPGLGHQNDMLRGACLKLWRVWGVEAHLIPMAWDDGRTFEEKYARLQTEIAKYERVILIGESAGAAMVLYAASRDAKNVARFVTLCGANNPAMPISDYIHKRSPAFVEAVRSLPRSYANLEKIHCYRALHDRVIEKKYSLVPGAKEVIVFSIGHLITISLCLTIYGPWFTRSVQK